jgi:hypothetical protein
MNPKNRPHNEQITYGKDSPSIQRHASILLVLSMVLGTTACSAIHPVQAWEKGYLAKNSMKFDYDKLAMKNSEHIYTSKEAAAGASSVGGGGCGCN